MYKKHTVHKKLFKYSKTTFEYQGSVRMGECEQTPIIVVWNQDETPYSIIGHKYGMLKFILVRRELDKVTTVLIDEQKAVVLNL